MNGYQEALEKMGEMVHSNYQTDVIIYKAKETEVPGQEPELEKIIESEIRMNEPLKFDGYTLYQSGFQENEFSSMTFKVFRTDDEEEQSLGEVTIDLLDPEPYVYVRKWHRS